jgi:hypothetical protein
VPGLAYVRRPDEKPAICGLFVAALLLYHRRERHGSGRHRRRHSDAGSDYTALWTTLTWLPGTPLVQYVEVAVQGDTVAEPLETSFVALSAPTGYALVSDSREKATIVNDD